MATQITAANSTASCGGATPGANERDKIESNNIFLW